MRTSGRMGMLGLAGIMGAGLAALSPVVVQQMAQPRGPHQTKTVARRRSYISLNRSRHWDYAETYGDARRISPIPHVPVR